jgi:hypothetical protein
VASNEDALAIALAEQERRKRQSFVAAQGFGVPTAKEKASSALNTAGRIANSVNAGIMSWLPQNAEEFLKGKGIGANPQPGAMGGAAQMIGASLPLMMGIPAIGEAVPSASVKAPGIMKSIFNNITKTALSSPKTYFAAETLAAGGAGALGEMAREEGAGAGAQLGAEFVGSMVGGAPAMAPRGLRAAREGITATLAPFSTEGGMIRASRQMQERAGGAERAATMASQLENKPSGVTPAQWIGDEVLLSQEARLLADNPALAAQVKVELQGARIAAQESLTGAFGRPRLRSEWEKSVLEKVTPEGTIIVPGQSDEMLDQAYKSFAPLYDSAKGHPIKVGALNQSLAQSSRDPEIIATKAERLAVNKWLQNQFSAVSRNIKMGLTDSDSLLELRSRIRDERRIQTKRGNMERADLLGSSEALITQRLEEQLSPDVVETLRAADSQYRKYKVVESALYNSGDANLTPEQLSQSIRMGGMTTQSRYARGVDPATQELRNAAMAGRSTEEVLGDPRRAALFVRGLDYEGKRGVQADFINVLFNRAKQQATDVTAGGLAFASGKKLVRDIAENEAVMRQLGTGQEDITRLKNMTNEIVRLEKKSPAALASLFEDGPATLMQLVATLIGVKQGQALAGGGLGSSLVLAQFMSNRARGILARWTSDEAAKLMRDAVTDPKLYRTLMTKEISSNRAAKEQAQYLESWLLASAMNKTLEEEQ